MGYSQVPLAIEAESFHGLGLLTTLSQQQDAGAKFTSLAMMYRTMQTTASRFAGLSASQRSSTSGQTVSAQTNALRTRLAPLMQRLIAAARRAKTAGLVDDQGFPTPAGMTQLGLVQRGRDGPNTQPASSLTLDTAVTAILADDLSAYVYGVHANPDDLTAIAAALPTARSTAERIQNAYGMIPGVGGGSGGVTIPAGTPPGGPGSPQGNGKPPPTPRSNKPPTGGSGTASSGTGSGGGGGFGGLGLISLPFGIKLPAWALLGVAGVGALAIATRRKKK